MKILLATAIISISAYSRDQVCELMTYSHEVVDYDSEHGDSCTGLIKMMMKDKGCSDKTVNAVRYYDIKSLSHGSSTMCIYENNAGIYQVMASEMAEPPRAVLMFSNWD